MGTLEGSNLPKGSTLTFGVGTPWEDVLCCGWGSWLNYKGAVYVCACMCVQRPFFFSLGETLAMEQF